MSFLKIYILYILFLYMYTKDEEIGKHKLNEMGALNRK